MSDKIMKKLDTQRKDVLNFKAHSLLLILYVSICAAVACDRPAAGRSQTGDELGRHLLAQAEKHWNARRSRVSALSTTSEVRARQKFIREWMTGAVGGFPERTPLNPRITGGFAREDRKSTRLNSSHLGISYAVFCLKKKKKNRKPATLPKQY